MCGEHVRREGVETRSEDGARIEKHAEPSLDTVAHLPMEGEQNGRHGSERSRKRAPRDAPPLGYRTGQGAHRQ